jgi:hypothetical protein
MDHDDLIARLVRIEERFNQYTKTMRWLLGVNCAILGAHLDVVIPMVRATAKIF